MDSEDSPIGGGVFFYGDIRCLRIFRISWVYLGTNRSVLSGFMMHLTGNCTSNCFCPYSDGLEIMRMVVVVVLGLVLFEFPGAQIEKGFLGSSATIVPERSESEPDSSASPFSGT